ncbi:uncharacterized protein BJ171DRAFT_476024 [Polychytrium aggregatum]|uniref:uncharacterized protein n=1 Tax=Polychytrium aggregatum TaxID=110093 RepID=UPI0022FF0293|nr:uncharacterized protein BJ171DRAFT_476024 [Polychytrium aggregatum]KAI9203387.1 hypothetical protein BJ171DRAFT_476024 [Polychytrium aggregatum]
MSFLLDHTPVAAGLLIDDLGPVEWTKLCAVSKRLRRQLDQPPYWRRLFRAYFRLSAAELDNGHRAAVIAADAFLRRTRATPYVCESEIWKAAVLSPRISAAMKHLATNHQAALAARWRHAPEFAAQDSRTLSNWVIHGTMPDDVGLHEMDEYELLHVHGCTQLPETVCFWRPIHIAIESHRLRRLPLSFGTLLSVSQHIELSCPKLRTIPSSGRLCGATEEPHAPTDLPQTELESADPNGVDLLQVSPGLLPDQLASPQAPAASPLQCLDLSGCSSLASLEFLSGLPNLTHLILVGCGQIESIAPLARLASLTHLDLTMCASVASVQPLETLVNLVDLSLLGCVLIPSISALSKLAKLRILNLRGCAHVDTLEPLFRLANLATVIMCRDHHTKDQDSQVRKLNEYRQMNSLGKVYIDYPKMSWVAHDEGHPLTQVTKPRQS